MRFNGTLQLGAKARAFQPSPVNGSAPRVACNSPTETREFPATLFAMGKPSTTVPPILRCGSHTDEGWLTPWSGASGTPPRSRLRVEKRLDLLCLRSGIGARLKKQRDPLLCTELDRSAADSKGHLRNCVKTTRILRPLSFSACKPKKP